MYIPTLSQYNERQVIVQITHENGIVEFFTGRFTLQPDRKTWLVSSNERRLLIPENKIQKCEITPDSMPLPLITVK